MRDSRLSGLSEEADFTDAGRGWLTGAALSAFETPRSARGDTAGHSAADDGHDISIVTTPRPEAGDQVLRCLAKCCRKEHGGMTGRPRGGVRVCVLLTRTERESGRIEVTERLRAAVELCNPGHAKNHCSFGLAEFHSSATTPRRYSRMRTRRCTGPRARAKRGASGECRTCA